MSPFSQSTMLFSITSNFQRLLYRHWNTISFTNNIILLINYQLYLLTLSRLHRINFMFVTDHEKKNVFIHDQHLDIFNTLV